MERTDLYFAYGTNMNRADLQAWCDREGLSYPLAGKVGNAWLPDMCQVFNFLSKRRGGGVSNLRHRTGQATPASLETLPDGWATSTGGKGADLQAPPRDRSLEMAEIQRGHHRSIPP